ncbi:MAG: hypothetical protein JSS65_13300 [Armatimonadetes bacterium]|nr:hypothetical protein [Armatimonadota bacterium]
MKLLSVLCWAVAALGVAAVVGGQVFQSTMASRAKLSQIVHVSAINELFGKPGYEPVGPAEEMVVDAPAAILSNSGPHGEQLLDQEKLLKFKVAPLRMATVRAWALVATVAGGMAGLLGLVGGVLLLTRGGKIAPPTDPET